MKKILKTLFQTSVIAFITLVLLELSYRTYIIDFYRKELKNLNSESDLEKTNVDFLVLGDSFSANTVGYVSMLREKHPDKVIINSGVAGFGIK